MDADNSLGMQTSDLEAFAGLDHSKSETKNDQNIEQRKDKAFKKLQNGVTFKNTV